MSDTTDRELPTCPRKKCGEYNMLRCCRRIGHEGECNFVVADSTDYPFPNERSAVRAAASMAGEKS